MEKLIRVRKETVRGDDKNKLNFKDVLIVYNGKEQLFYIEADSIEVDIDCDGIVFK